MRIVKTLFTYLLWSIFSIILFLLLVGYAKTNWNLREYVYFLNDHSWSVFSWSDPATWSDPFWPNWDAVLTIEDSILDESSLVDSWTFDPYDPAFEDELSNLPQSDISVEDNDFGFVTEDTLSTSSGNTTQSSSTIKQLIEQRK